MLAMSRRWFLVLPLVVVCLLLAQNWVVFKVAEWTLYRVFEESFAGELEWDAIEHKGATIVLHAPKVTKGEEIPFFAERLTLHWDFRLLSRTLFLDTEIVRPEGKLNRSQLDLLSNQKNLGFLLKIQGALKIVEGKVDLPGGPVSLELSLNFMDDMDLELSLRQAAAHLQLVGKRKNGELDIRLEAADFPLSIVSDFIDTLTPSLIEARVLKGNLKGSFAAHLSPHFKPQVAGELDLIDFVMHGMKGGYSFDLKQLSIRLKPTDLIKKDPLYPWLPSLEGEIFLASGSKIEWGKFGKRPLIASHLAGSVRLLKEGKGDIELKGIEEYEGEQGSLLAVGALDYQDLENLKLDFHYLSEPQKRLPTSLEIHTNPSNISVDIKNFGIQQFSLIEAALHKMAPGLNPIDFREGRVDANLKAKVENRNITALSIENLQLRNLSCRSKEWECSFGAEAIAGFVFIDFGKPHPSKTLNVDLAVHNGRLLLETPPVDLWNFTDIQTRLTLKEGVIQTSSASVNLAGLKGTAKIDTHSLEQPLTLHFEGKASDLARFMPPKVRQGIESASPNDELFVDLTLNPEKEHYRFGGSAKVRDGRAFYNFTFGFDLKPSDPFRDKGFTPLLLSDSLGPWGPGAAHALLAKVEKDAGLFGFRFTDGWILSKKMPLEKFVSPYLFSTGNIRLSGDADIRATFDLKGLTLSYTAYNVLLDTDKIQITMKEVPGASEGDYLGEQYIDFATGRHRGSVPLDQATYFDKAKNLLFNHIRTEAIFDGRKVFFPDISASAYGLDFLGNILLDNSDEREGYFDVYVDAYQVEGTLPMLEKLLEKIDPSLLVASVPVEGQVHLKGEGAKFIFNVAKDAFSWDGKVQGMLSDGSFNLGQTPLNSKEFTFNFEFDKSQDFLHFTDVSGTLFLGEENLKEAYPFYIDKVGFDSLKTKEGVFNLQIFDPKGELLRIAGTTHGENEHLLFNFDSEACHFGDVKPNAIVLRMSGLSKVEHFQLNLTLDLERLVKGLLPFVHAGLSQSPQFLRHLEDLKGNLKSQFSYSDTHGKFLFDFIGDSVSYKEHAFKDIALSGDYQEGVWRVKEARGDDLSFSLNATKRKDTWHLEHLGLKVGEALILALNGEWEEGSDELQANVNLLEVSLDKLSEFDELKPFYEKFYPKGLLKGSGKLIVGKNQAGEAKCEANLTTYFKNIELQGFHFQDFEPSTLQFIMGQGLQFRNLKTALLYPETETPFVDLFLEKIEIDFESDTTLVEGLRYHLPADNLPWLALVMEKVFPQIMTPYVKESVSTLKKSGNASGSIDVKLKEGDVELKIALADGVWHLFGWDADLKNFNLELDNDEIKVRAQYVLDNQLVWILSRVPRQTLSHGVIVIADATGQEGASVDEPITLYWEKEEGRGIVIKEVKGSAVGLKVALREDPDHPTSHKWMSLKGNVFVNFNQASQLLPDEIKKKLQAMQFGNGWSLEGSLQLEKESLYQERAYHFEGNIYGSLCELKGYCFERLHAQLTANANTFYLSQIQLHDPAGALFVNYAHFDKNAQGQWIATIPRIEASEIRPSLLSEVGTGRSGEVKPLTITHLIIHDITGPLNPLSELRGTGTLHFINPVKKNLHNTIFALPAEILSRIGIDLIALTPVTGTVHFQIRDEAVVLTKLKDVYSDGKLSKFYLSDSRNPSYMEFDGTLHVQIKMRQHTLLFKLAELFTFNIEGSLSKPVYSLQKGGRG